MSSERHALTIGTERIDKDFYLSIKVVGKLTHEDYQKFTPMIDSALESVKDAKINVLFDGADFHGWEARAAWDDFKLWLRHGGEFDKIAMYGLQNWQDWAAKIGSWFVSGEMKHFTNMSQAIGWLRGTEIAEAAKK